ncbi:MAG: SURF1 family protein [Pseudoxanthomonas sp.]
MTDDTAPPHSRLAKAIVLTSLALACIGFCALGVWQVKRLAWKLDLIERVESRIHAAAVPAPTPADWNQVSAARDEYRRVCVGGHFLEGRDTRVDALTERGAGDWILSPLQAQGGYVVMVNRGFVPKGSEYAASPYNRPDNSRIVCGLLRISEPKGRILRPNQPETDRWFSRDVAAIAARRGLTNVAPYFIDADLDPAAAQWPRGGMTVVSFRNNHLQYALTWFALALLAAFATWRFAREDRKP